MDILKAKRQIKDTVEAYLEKDDAGMYAIAPVHQRPVFLLGAPGIGKTAIMEQVAEELGIGIVSYSMTHHTRQSALGLPRIERRNFDGFEFEASEYTMSEIVAAIYDYMERTGIRNGILFLDEINCVSETLYPSMLQFLQFKTFGKHKVPQGWVVVCAGNPPEYNRSVHEFDIVTLDRLREIDVEPDYAAWKSYATERGMHPAVTSFLEAKKDCFYKVESKPGGGKSFVTARGWEDLADLISLYEGMGKPVNRELIVQFIRDDEVADQFAIYYSLFEKYRSDYQVDTILSGNAPEAIANRAREAEFDERVALISLILDMLATDCANVVDQEGVIVQIRDFLRQAKEGLLAGGSLDVCVSERIAEREAMLARKIDAGNVSHGYIRRERLVIGMLKELVAKCMLEKTMQGEAAFKTIEAAYKEEVVKIKPAAANASARMDNAFDFVDRCFGNREMLIFMAELATRKPTTQFVAHYGNEKYYAHNDEMQADSARMGLEERASMLENLNANIESAKSDIHSTSSDGADNKGPGIMSPSGATSGSAHRIESTVQPHVMEEGMHPAVMPNEPAARAEALSQAKASIEVGGANAASGQGATMPSQAELKSFYSTKEFEYGFASVCKMLLPASDLKGKRVLDIGSRRGRGVYKISSMVGNSGEAIGIDWSPSYVAESIDGINRAWHDSGLSGNNMDFRLAYPEDLISAGIGSSTMDVVYVNNVMTLFYDQQQALREFARVLKPGGLLIMETIFADRDRDRSIVEAAREMGNSIQAALTEAQNLEWLEAAGFGQPEVKDEYEVAANRGYKAGETVDTVPGDEDVKYKAVSLFVRKK